MDGDLILQKWDFTQQVPRIFKQHKWGARHVSESLSITDWEGWNWDWFHCSNQKGSVNPSNSSKDNFYTWKLQFLHELGRLICRTGLGLDLICSGVPPQQRVYINRMVAMYYIVVKLGLLVSYFIFWNRGGSREGFSAILALVSNGSMKSHEATIAAPATPRWRWRNATSGRKTRDGRGCRAACAMARRIVGVGKRDGIEWEITLIRVSFHES